MSQGIFHMLMGSTGGFTPLDLEAKLEFWFDNADASTITLINTNEVDSQTDKTGNFTRLPNTDSNGNRPTYDSARKEIFYNGTQFGLVLQEALSAGAKAGGEIFVVTRRRHDWTAAGAPTFFGAYDTITTNRNCLLRDLANDATAANRSMSLFWRNGASSSNIRGNINSISDKINIFDFRIDPGVEYIFDWDNRGVIGETAASGLNDGKWIDDLTSFNKVSFGFWQSGGTSFFSAYYELEFIYCNEILTTQERTNVYNYLNTKHLAFSTSTQNIGLVQWGQSNAVGQGINSSRPNRLLNPELNTNIKVWTATNTFSQYTSSNDGGNDFGSDLSLLSALAEYCRSAQIYFVKVALTGAPIASEAGRMDFNIANTGELYDELELKSLELQTALDALGSNVIFTKQIQGERDAREANGGEPDAYQANLNNILNGLSTAGFNADYHIINKLDDDLVNSTETPAITLENLQTVQAAQVAVVNSRANARLLDRNNFDLNPADFTHYLGTEYIKIGEYCFSQIIKALI